MQLSEVSFLDMVPRLFRSDRTVKGIADACDGLLQTLLDAGALLPLWTRINEQPEMVLDEMAAALNLLWYDRGATLTQKRAIVSSAETVYRQLGTPQAVRQVAEDYFGAATVEEWWEYEGDPGHFRIKIPAQTLTETQIDRFARNIRWVKRASALFDTLTVVEAMETTLYAGGAYHEIGTDYLMEGA